MPSNIHKTAIVEKGAVLGKDVVVGPYSVVGEGVELGDNVKLHSHVVVVGNTKVGSGTEVFSFASIGHIPQDLKYKGEESLLVIGKNNKIREHVTIHPGTEGGGMITSIGDNCLLMVSCHVAHDCIVGNNVILANNATLAGHVILEDNVLIGGLSAVHQFVRIGKGAMVGGMSGIENDIIPYGLAMGERASLAGLNLVGLKRSNSSKDDIHGLRSAFKELFDPKINLNDAIEIVKQKYSSNKKVLEIIDFLIKDSSRAICRPK